MGNSQVVILPPPMQQMEALQEAIYLLGGKWRIPIINAICNGSHRFTTILNNIPGITRRSLAKELKEMEQNFIITRTVRCDTPLLVEYHTTEYSESFSPIIIALISFGIEHKKKMLYASMPIKKVGTINAAHQSA